MTHRGLSYRLPAAERLPDGDYTLTARVADLSGNWSAPASLGFRVQTPSTIELPFERTQLVWVRTDLDRDGSGGADFDDDLVRLGLLAEGDPAGTNARMRRIVLDGIFAQVYRLLGRAPDGSLLGPESIAIRVTDREPIGVAHMQMALGGFDPEGERDRGYGDESTGVLGRAFYDYRNAAVNERNIFTSPALGVFPGEMFLFQTNLHLQVSPSFLTTFAVRFVNLCPDMGGTPVGTHALDATVLAEDFDYGTAPSAQKARYSRIFDAADDWATVIGVILAHETGHSVGLVAPGVSPRGLFGDSSLHNEYSAAAEVMASAVGYDSMVSLDYHFRDVNAAYLRQRLLLK